MTRGALDDRLEHRLQDRARNRLFDLAPNLAVVEQLEIWLLPLDGNFHLERVRHPVVHCGAGLDGLQPTLPIRAQPHGDVERSQAVIGRVEIDRAQVAGHRLGGGKIAERGMPAHALQLVAGELDLELQLALPGKTHRQTPTRTTGFAPQSAPRTGPAPSWRGAAISSQQPPRAYPQKYRTIPLHLRNRQPACPRRTPVAITGNAVVTTTG